MTLKRTYLILFVLFFSSLFVPLTSDANQTLIPKIGDSDETPVINGNITETEWNSSVVFETTINNYDASIRVTSNQSHLFIGFNYTAPQFTEVNSTVPTYNQTLTNYTLGYNNATHDWLALVIDNNLDQVFDSATNTIGTESSPDDIMVVDQYNASVYDGYANANTSQLFSPDRSILYNGTVDDADLQDVLVNGTTLYGNDGEFNGFAARKNYTTTDNKEHIVYEFTKPYSGLDENGFDFSLEETKIFQFRFLQWINASANATMTNGYDNFDFTEWYSLRVNENGTGIALQTPGNTTINLQLGYTNQGDYKAMETILDHYGFDTTINTEGLENTTLSNYNLSIIIFGGETDITQAGLDALKNYLRLGGKAIILLSDAVAGNSNTFAEEFGISYLSNQVLLPIDENQSSSELNIDASSIPSVLNLVDSPSLTLDDTLVDLNYTSNALNTSKLFGAEKSRYVLSQEYLTYDLFSAPENAVYDDSDDGFVNDTETFNSDYSLGLGLDLLKGGRVTLLPSTSIFSNDYLTQQDNLPFLLKLIPWNARLVQTLEIHSADVDRNNVKIRNEITVTVNITDGLGETLTSTPVVEVEMTIAGSTPKIVQLEQTSTANIYSATFILEQKGFLKLRGTGQLSGYGFDESEFVNIYVQQVIESYNDLSKLDIILIAIFLASSAMVALVYLRYRK